VTCRHSVNFIPVFFVVALTEVDYEKTGMKSQRERPITSIDGSNDAFWHNGVPFPPRNQISFGFEVTLPQIRLICPQE
jgi:hypothetical protein